MCDTLPPCNDVLEDEQQEEKTGIRLESSRRGKTWSMEEKKKNG